MPVTLSLPHGPGQAPSPRLPSAKAKNSPARSYTTSSVQSSRLAPRSSPRTGLAGRRVREPGWGAATRPRRRDPRPPGLSRHEPGFGPGAASTPSSARGDEAGSDARTREVRELAAPAARPGPPPLTPALLPLLPPPPPPVPEPEEKQRPARASSVATSCVGAD